MLVSQDYNHKHSTTKSRTIVRIFLSIYHTISNIQSIRPKHSGSEHYFGVTTPQPQAFNHNLSYNRLKLCRLAPRTLLPSAAWHAHRVPALGVYLLELSEPFGLLPTKAPHTSPLSDHLRSNLVQCHIHNFDTPSAKLKSISTPSLRSHIRWIKGLNFLTGSRWR